MAIKIKILIKKLVKIFEKIFKKKSVNILVFIFFLHSQQIFAQGDMATQEDLQKLQSDSDSQTEGERKAKTKLKSKKPAAKKRPKDTGQNASIKIDGSAVYEYPNFDSPVVEYMDRDKSVKISKKIYPGIGGLGAFYKIRLRKGVFGYIADTDVLLKGGKSALSSDDESESDPLKIQEKMMGPDSEDSGAESGGDSLYLTRFLGLTYSNYNYVETLRKKSEEAATPLIGIKVSGPTKFLGGFPLDANFVFTTTAPDFYDEIASSTSGFMLIGDAAITIPLSESKRHIVYYGAGLLLRYSSWDVKLKSSPSSPAIDSQEVALGVLGLLGAGFTFTPKVMLKLDGKYNYEKEKYFAYGLSLQFRY